MANGTSGWGPPPSGPPNTSGWGAPPPPNPAASAAWGAPGAGNKADADLSSFNAPVGAKPQPMAMPSAPGPAPVQQPPVASAPVASGLVQPPQTSTSWAAAAGKGLPVTTNEQTHTTASITASAASNGSTSKHLEQLNSVREALFSQVRRQYMFIAIFGFKRW